MRLRTEMPRSAPTAPHFAPVFGAISMPAPDLREITADPGALAPTPTVRPGGMVPELLTGLVVAGGAGGLTGILAAGSWQGAAIGAGVNVAGWSLLTLLASWRRTDTRERVILGTAGIVGLVAMGGLIWARRRKKGVT